MLIKQKILVAPFAFLFFLLSSFSVFSKNNNRDSINKHLYIVADITVLGNRTTKKHIIDREIPFHVGDTIFENYISHKLASAKQNLLNTSLFNFIKIDTFSVAVNYMSVLITVAERWYTWPIPIFEFQERNFNDWWIRKSLERVNYGFSINRYNFRGRKERLNAYAQLGYTVKYGLSYEVPYLNKKQTSGVGFSFSYARNSEVAYLSDNNQQLFFKNLDEFVREEWIAKLKYYYRKNIYSSHYFEFMQVDVTVHDTLKTYSADYFSHNNTRMKYIALEYSFINDRRDSKSYPLTGHFAELGVAKIGVNANLDVTNFYFNVKKYKKIYNRFYSGAGIKSKISANHKQPYYVQKALGWKDFIRGYEYYVVDGQQFALLKGGLKYELMKPHVIEAPLPFNKFNKIHYAIYLNAYADAGYVQDRMYASANPLSNSWLIGYGIGLDYVTYYDLVLRFECSVNKRNEIGFFIHFNAGI